MHFGDHLGGEQKRDYQIADEGNVLEGRHFLKGFRSVQADRGERDQCAESHQSSYPQLKSQAITIIIIILGKS